jgi:pimeloyl-ACP methyl ester carboxylesterase
VLYAWAKNDAAIAWSRSRRAALTAPDHAIAMFDASHSAFLEQPEAFDAALVHFLEKHRVIA